MYGTNSSATQSVLVQPAGLSSTALQSVLSAQLSSSGGLLSTMQQLASVGSTMLNVVDCTAAPNCTSLSRYPCVNVPNTCGSCVYPYIGNFGSANSMCYSLYATRRLEDFPVDYATTMDTGSPDRLNDGHVSRNADIVSAGQFNDIFMYDQSFQSAAVDRGGEEAAGASAAGFTPRSAFSVNAIAVDRELGDPSPSSHIVTNAFPTTPRPTPRPSTSPTTSPTLAPTNTPAPTYVQGSPTPQPTSSPTVTPSCKPTPDPTFKPSFSPTYVKGRPTPQPTAAPSISPTAAPTCNPTYLPGSPTFLPSASPTAAPTLSPTMSPTYIPGNPTPGPTNKPTFSASCQVAADCKIWESCVDFHCSLVPKSCAGNCSYPHGYCSFRSKATGYPVSACTTGDPTCVATCNCKRSYKGVDCSISSSDFSSIQASRYTLLSSLSSAVRMQDPSPQSITATVSSLVSITQIPSQLSLTAVALSAQIASSVLTASQQSEIPYYYAAGVMKVVNNLYSASPSNVTVNFRRRRLMPIPSYSISGLTVISEFATLVLDSMYFGQTPQLYLQDQFALICSAVQASASKSASFYSVWGNYQSAYGLPTATIRLSTASTSSVAFVGVSAVQKYNDFGWNFAVSNVISYPTMVTVGNPTVCGGSSCAMSIMLPNVVSQYYPVNNYTIGRQKTVRCSLSSYFSSILYCPGLAPQNIECNGTFAGWVTFACPYNITQGLCSAYSLNGSVVGSCGTTSFDSSQTSCTCTVPHLTGITNTVTSSSSAPLPATSVVLLATRNFQAHPLIIEYIPLSARPTTIPTPEPSARPSTYPTPMPVFPTTVPTPQPSGVPTLEPSPAPSGPPVISPTPEPTTPPTPGPPVPSSPPKPSNVGLIAGVVVVVLLLLGGGGAGATYWYISTKKADSVVGRMNKIQSDNRLAAYLYVSGKSGKSDSRAAAMESGALFAAVSSRAAASNPVAHCGNKLSQLGELTSFDRIQRIQKENQRAALLHLQHLKAVQEAATSAHSGADDDGAADATAVGADARRSNATVVLSGTAGAGAGSSGGKNRRVPVGGNYGTKNEEDKFSSEDDEDVALEADDEGDSDFEGKSYDSSSTNSKGSSSLAADGKGGWVKSGGSIIRPADTTDIDSWTKPFSL